MDFLEKLEKATKTNNSLLCVGLDTDLQKIPQHLLDKNDPILAFNKAIIDATADLVCCYKPQIAYYEAHGPSGLKSLKQTVDYIHNQYSDIPVIIDAKRADIGSTSEQYAVSLLDNYHFDAITVNPYLGFDALEPFLRRKDKGIIILCRTSNPGASDFQDLRILSPRPLGEGQPLYLHVAKRAVRWNREYGNCLLVVGATWPRQVREIREVAKKMWFLVPGMGAQGGNLEQTLKFGLRKDNSGLIINAARSIIYAGKKEDFAEKARQEALKMREQINLYR